MKSSLRLILSLTAFAPLAFHSPLHAQSAPANVTILHSFNGGTEGSEPLATLILGRDGNFYGTTDNGDDFAASVFQATPTGTVNTLHPFMMDVEAIDNARASLVEGSDGNFYGTRFYDSADTNFGIVFRVSATGTGYTVLHKFANGTDGANPASGLVEGKDGNFYGTTSNSTGDANGGTVFQMTPQGAIKTLHQFMGGADGANPMAGLVLGRDGNLYGTTQSGGKVGDAGVVFQITTAGVFKTLHEFDVDDGAFPEAALVEGQDGVFYGTTNEGGANSAGTIFRVTSQGGFTKLHDFAGNNSDTGFPFSGLALGGDGNLYGTGTASNKSVNGIYRISPSSGGYALVAELTDAGSPVAGLVRGGDGNFYGVTDDGGSNGSGTFYRFNMVPVITSATHATAQVGKAFSYQIMATGSPTSYGVQGLPGGLTVNATTGVISGAPKFAGTFSLTLNAYNGQGKGSATLTLTVAAAVPVVTGGTANGTQGVAFSYQINATNSPTAYGVQGLPGGLTVNASTGLLSGTPKFAGTFTLTLNAYNNVGKGSGTLTLTVTQ